MDIQSLSAAGKYAASRAATKPTEGSAAGAAFMDFAKDFSATLKAGEDTSLAAMTGNADPHSLVQALSQAELAVETAVTVRDKVVEAYQEILRMPV